MQKSEVAKLLAFASGADRREVNELAVEVWFDLVGDLDFEEALEAVKGHYRAETRAIFPADVLRITAKDDDMAWARDRS